MIHCCVPKLTNRDSSAEQRKVQTHLLMTVLVVLPQCPHFVFFLCLSYRDVYTHIDICTYNILNMHKNKILHLNVKSHVLNINELV